MRIRADNFGHVGLDGAVSTTGARSPWSAKLQQGSARRARAAAEAAARLERHATRRRSDVLQLCHWLQTELVSDEPDAELQIWDEAQKQLAQQVGWGGACRLIELTRQHEHDR